MEKQKVVLITGCSSGFGYGMALKFARNGYTTIATVRNLKSSGAEALKKFVTNEQLPLEILHLDVTDTTSIKESVENIEKKYGQIDVLINNAGYGYLGPIEEVDLEDMQKLYDTNVLGVVRMVKAVVPMMRKQHSGKIINFSSINGIVPFPLFSIYSSTKFAIETLTEGLRFELKPFGIDVSMVEPGSYLTNFATSRVSPKYMMRNDSPYRPLLETFFNRYKKTHNVGKEHFASKTADPQEVVERVFTIVESKKSKLRYLIGRDAYKNYIIRKLLPYPVWEWLLEKVYKWG